MSSANSNSTVLGAAAAAMIQPMRWSRVRRLGMAIQSPANLPAPRSFPKSISSLIQIGIEIEQTPRRSIDVAVQHVRA
jgi:hypothetical protein